MQYQYSSKWKAYLDNKTHKHSFLTQKVSAIKSLVEEGCVWAGLTLCYYAFWKGVLICFSTQRYNPFLISKRYNNAFSLCIIMTFSVTRNFIKKGRYSVYLFYSQIGFRTQYHKRELIINVLWFVLIFALSENSQNVCFRPTPFLYRNRKLGQTLFRCFSPILKLLPTLLRKLYNACTKEMIRFSKDNYPYCFVSYACPVFFIFVFSLCYYVNVFYEPPPFLQVIYLALLFTGVLMTPFTFLVTLFISRYQ